MPVPSVPDIEALADAGTLKRARSLVHRAKWGRLGLDDAALWGVARGSRNYDVRVALADLSPHCDCPSARRVRYCKHLIALMLFAAESPQSFELGESRPDAVHAWVQEKEEAAERKRARDEAKAERAAERAERAAQGLPPTAEELAEEAKREEARAKRAAESEARVTAGLDALDLWLRDIVRDGIAGLESQADDFFEQQSRALVDAQASGLARRVASLAAVPGSGPDWPERMLDRLGRLAVLTDAYLRRDTLPPALLDDLRRAVGWKTRKDDVLARGERVRDRWLMVGRFRDEDDDGLRRERAWFVGLSTGRRALCLQYGRAGSVFEHRFTLGCTMDADLVFWPSAAPMRVTVAARRGNDEPWTGDVPGVAFGVDEFLDQQADTLAKVPWTWTVPCWLHAAVPCVSDDGWWLQDRHARALPLREGTHWTLAALAGGTPIPVIAEWDGRRLLPLAGVIDGRIEPVFEGAFA